MKKTKKLFEKYGLLKIILIVIAITILCTWIIPHGYFSGGKLISSGLGRQGLSDVWVSIISTGSTFLQQLFFIICIGIFYGILSKTSGYKALTSKIAQIFKGKEKLFVLGSSLLITLMTSFLDQSYVVVMFIPLLITIVSKMNLDKLTSFLMTFGSMLVGILGATYGTESLIYFIKYLGNAGINVDITTEIGIRFGILAFAFIVYNFFTLRHMNKVGKKVSDENKVKDLFAVENTTDKKVKVWPMGLMFIVLLAFTILGYVDWETNFNITIFDDFHTWLTGLAIGQYPIVSYILGNNALAFGKWYLYTILIVLGFILIIAALIYKLNLDDCIEGAIYGIKKIAKTFVLIFLIYSIFMIIYQAPFTVTISNWIMSVADGFNPFLSTLASFITSIFHIDFGYTGFILGDFMASHFGDAMNVGFLNFATINGLTQFIAPTSIFAIFGLSYLDIPYQKWLKYIWKFVVIMLVALLILFSAMAYL